MQSVLDDAIERYRRERFLRAANADFAALKTDEKSWKRELHDRELWKKRWLTESPRNEYSGTFARRRLGS